MDPQSVPYAILSHVWAKSEKDLYYPESTYQFVLQIQAHAEQQTGRASSKSTVPLLPAKIREFCKLAARFGYDYAWGDTFCIDKTSSSELSEAITSMFDWYQYADLCCVYLADVKAIPKLDAHGQHFCDVQCFCKSQWFRRGWTLQELLAPPSVHFFSSRWEPLGSKHSLASLISSASGIPHDVLVGKTALGSVSVARRMSWAAVRQTKRKEDEAYSLMGIFGVRISMAYGEGSHAFVRLQEEILKIIPDQTIFAWGRHLKRLSLLRGVTYYFPRLPESPRPLALAQPISASQTDPVNGMPDGNLFASSPQDFHDCANLESIPEVASERTTYTFTPHGVYMQLPVVSIYTNGPSVVMPSHIALLACKTTESKADDTRYLALVLRPRRPEECNDCFVGSLIGTRDEVDKSLRNNNELNIPPECHYRTVWLSATTWDHCRQACRTIKLCIPYRTAMTASDVREGVNHPPMAFFCVPQQRGATAEDAFKLSISKLSQDMLRPLEYEIRLDSDRGGYKIDVLQKGRPVARAWAKCCTCRNINGKAFLAVGFSADLGSAHVQPNGSASHGIDDDRHVKSWDFANGIASKRYVLPGELVPDGGHRRLAARLSLTQTSKRSEGPVGCPEYVLGVEMWWAQQDDFASSTDLARESRQSVINMENFVTPIYGGIPPGSPPPPPPPNQESPGRHMRSYSDVVNPKSHPLAEKHTTVADRAAKPTQPGPSGESLPRGWPERSRGNAVSGKQPGHSEKSLPKSHNANPQPTKPFEEPASVKKQGKR
ncbi:hypothetical protein BN946_scf185008.g51 [Trametes cinnabarina]|uniref:Uncharacterized protein n=1 Tax=Pycnoporus cinnabarinus TaxID=5643 RepID=A0A060SM64_PYCCI|nr:hypothetical protein BN946_scf185008.g51 [Trametes cinnabarina]